VAPQVDVNFYDISDKSCLNGWAMGNIAASGMNLAMFFRDLFGPADPAARLLPPALAAAMVGLAIGLVAASEMEAPNRSVNLV
jgi:hypothetical protein